MSRRARGEGTVLRDGDGWIARIELPVGPDGKRRRRKRRARTKSEAFALLKELQKEVESIDNPHGLRRNVTEAVDFYLANRPNTGRSEMTIEIDASRGRTLARGLGRREIGKLTVADCDRFLADVAAGAYGRKPLKPDSVRRIRALLVAVLRNEQRLGNLSRNVAELSQMPVFEQVAPSDDDDGDSSTSVRRILSLDEYRRLRNGCDGALQLFVDLCGRCGLRPSEARALRWSRLDLEQRTLRVDAQLSSKNKLVSPKTRRSRRTISVDDDTLALLNRWAADQAAQRANAGSRWDDGHDYVLTTKNGTAFDGSNLRDALAGHCERLGLDVYLPYELRHTAITFQLDQGAESWEVADWAGTSERMIELIYRHRTTRVSRLAPLPLDAGRVPAKGPAPSRAIAGSPENGETPLG